jgi:hypothetical protein
MMRDKFITVTMQLIPAPTEAGQEPQPYRDIVSIQAENVGTWQANDLHPDVLLLARRRQLQITERLASKVLGFTRTCIEQKSPRVPYDSHLFAGMLNESESLTLGHSAAQAQAKALEVVFKGYPTTPNHYLPMGHQGVVGVIGNGWGIALHSVVGLGFSDDVVHIGRPNGRLSLSSQQELVTHFRQQDQPAAQLYTS